MIWVSELTAWVECKYFLGSQVERILWFPESLEDRFLTLDCFAAVFISYNTKRVVDKFQGLALYTELQRSVLGVTYK